MLLKNITQDIVFEKLEEMVGRDPKLCRCERCRMDAAAIALNNLPPRYVVTERGAVFSKIESLDFQITADVVKELTKAIEQVSANPRHDADDEGSK